MHKLARLAVGLQAMWACACTSTNAAHVSEEPIAQPPQQAVIDQSGALKMAGPADIEVRHEYCRPGTEFEAGRIMIPQIELGLSYPVGTGGDDDNRHAVPYIKSSCAPN